MRRTLEMLRRNLGLDRHDVEVGEEPAPQPPNQYNTESVTGSAENYQLGPDDGVRIDPMPVTGRSEITIGYSGLLAQSGADQIYLHCGEGPGPWRNVRNIPMEQGGNAGEWVARIEAGDEGTLEFCFHDAADHWDNNTGVNWSVTVHSGRSPH